MANSAFSNVPSRAYISVESITGDFDFASSQDGYYLRWTGVSNITGNFRTEATHPISDASVFTVFQAGAGTVTITGAGGVTINGNNVTAGQNKALQVIKSGSDTYDALGGTV